MVIYPFIAVAVVDLCSPGVGPFNNPLEGPGLVFNDRRQMVGGRRRSVPWSCSSPRELMGIKNQFFNCTQ